MIFPFRVSLIKIHLEKPTPTFLRYEKGSSNQYDLPFEIVKVHKIVQMENFIREIKYGFHGSWILMFLYFKLFQWL